MENRQLRIKLKNKFIGEEYLVVSENAFNPQTHWLSIITTIHEKNHALLIPWGNIEIIEMINV